MLRPAVVLEWSAPMPLAVLALPVVLARKAWVPTAVFSNPVVVDVGWLNKSVSTPTATLSLFQAAPPLSKDWVVRALFPTATFRLAVVLAKSALTPVPVLTL